MELTGEELSQISGGKDEDAKAEVGINLITLTAEFDVTIGSIDVDGSYSAT